MKIELEQVSPHEIEKRSFEIITEELNGRTFPEDQELVVKRCIKEYSYSCCKYYKQSNF